MPGGITEGRRLYEEARRSTWGLIVHLRKAGVVNAVADLSMPSALLGDVAIQGIIDLLTVTANGRSAVVDLKYGGGKAKREELVTNTALQLAVYSRLLHPAKQRAFSAGCVVLSQCGDCEMQTHQSRSGIHLARIS